MNGNLAKRPCQPELTEYTFPLVKSHKRPKRPKSQPESAASIVSSVVASLGGTHRGQEQTVFSVFDHVIGPHLCQHARPDSLSQGTLYICVVGSAMAHQVTLMRGEILEKMSLHLPPGMVTQIRTRVGSIRRE